MRPEAGRTRAEAEAGAAIKLALYANRRQSGASRPPHPPRLLDPVADLAQCVWLQCGLINARSVSMTHSPTGRLPACSPAALGQRRIAGFRFLLIGLLLALLCLSAVTSTHAQAPAPAAPPAEAAPAAPAPIALADVAVEAETASALVRRFETRSRNLDALDTAGDELPVLARDMGVRTVEMRRLLTHNTPLETIRSLEAEWRYLENRSAAITRDLTKAAAQLDRDLAELDKLDATWSATRDAAVTGAAPQAVLGRVREVANDVARVRPCSNGALACWPCKASRLKSAPARDRRPRRWPMPANVRRLACSMPTARRSGGPIRYRAKRANCRTQAQAVSAKRRRNRRGGRT